MTESLFISTFIHKEFTDDHAVIYLYVCGNSRSQELAVNKAMELLTLIFCPCIPPSQIKRILVLFLETKKEQYKKNLIKVKPIY